MAERPGLCCDYYLPNDITSMLSYSGREPARFFAEALPMGCSTIAGRGSVVVTTTGGPELAGCSETMPAWYAKCPGLYYQQAALPLPMASVGPSTQNRSLTRLFVATPAGTPELPPTLLRWIWEAASAPGCKMVLMMNLDTLTPITQPVKSVLQAFSGIIRGAWQRVTEGSMKAWWILHRLSLTVPRRGISHRASVDGSGHGLARHDGENGVIST